MDIPTTKIYDVFKDEILKELGALDPDWFEALTAQSFNNEENVSEQDDLCANEEIHFKTPFEKAAAESQLFSTPKVFRHIQVATPESENELIIAEQEKNALPWMVTQSPHFIQTLKKGGTYGGMQSQSRDSFDLLHTPQKSPSSYAKHISESLGAQIHPDISWTSSLNTPPAIASTLILTKPDESPCPVSLSAEKNVVLVRKLFPSLSNASRVGVVSPQNNDNNNIHQGVASPVSGHNPESIEAPNMSLNYNDCVWRKKLPDAIEDEEIRKTVAGVLDGAEDVLSMFFSNSSSSLRIVKSDRIKRKQIIPTTKPHDCSSADVPKTNNAVPREQGAAYKGAARLLSLPTVKTGDMGITQWSPLSFSEIPSCTVDTSFHENSSTNVKNNISTEQVQSDLVSGQEMKIASPGFTKGKRKFVYKVGASKLHDQGNNSQVHSSWIPDCGQKTNVKQSVKAPDEGEWCFIQRNEMKQRGSLDVECVSPSVGAKVQDLSISQLSRDFAQDFSQMPDHHKVAKDMLRNAFSPSNCLSAMGHANHKERQVNLHQDVDLVLSGRSGFTTDKNNLINEATIRNSGFQSAVLETATPSSSIPTNSESNDRSQQCTGFVTDIHKTYSLKSTHKEEGKAYLDDILQEDETSVKLSHAVNYSQTLDPGRHTERYVASTSTKPPSCGTGTADVINFISPYRQVHSSLPEKSTVSPPSVHASGFKTASDKGIHISSVNLDRAKRLFGETEGEMTLSDQSVKYAKCPKSDVATSHESVKLNSNQPLSSRENVMAESSPLTASQKADVTELCTLLEEAESQFEFTQFKTTKLRNHCPDNSTSPQNSDKELDCNLFSGIDFDDSFSTDAQKALPATHDNLTAVKCGEANPDTFYVTIKSSSLNAMKKENSSIENVSSSSKPISEDNRDIMPSIPKNFDIAGNLKASNRENRSLLMPSLGFKTARGNVLRISKKCLSKAQALFADLDENFATSEKNPNNSKPNGETDAKMQHKCTVGTHTGNLLYQIEDKGQLPCSDKQVRNIKAEDAARCFRNSKVDTSDCQSGLQNANGNRISISVKAMQEADAIVKDCDIAATDTGTPVKHKSVSPGIVNHRKVLQKCKNAEVMKVSFSEEPVNKSDILNAGPANHHEDIHGDLILTPKALLSLTSATSSNGCSTAINESSNSSEFCIAKGKNLLLHADGIKKGDCLLDDNHELEDVNKQLKRKGDGHFPNHIYISPPKNEGFQTASGKRFTISSAALKKAQSMLSELNEVEDKICSKLTHSRMPFPCTPPRKHGFPTASDKPLFKSEALPKSKTLSSDRSFSTEIVDVAHTVDGDEKQTNTEHLEKKYCGFSTAGGAKVCVSQKNLLKAKNILKEFDDGSLFAIATQEAHSLFKGCDMDSVMSAKNRKCTAPVSGICSEKKNLPTFEKTKHNDDVEIHGGVLKNTLDSANALSSNGNPSLMMRPLDSNVVGCSSANEMRNCGGFSTASGKKVSVSDDAMIKAKSLLDENATCDDTLNQLKPKVNSLPLQNAGFHTASGKGVTNSSAALKKAKTLLGDCEGAEGKISVKVTHSETLVPSPPHRKHGFAAASGKPVAFSFKDLQKAKALFSDISFSAEIDMGSRTMKSERKNDIYIGNVNSGFTPAEQNLYKRMNLLNDLTDHSNSYSNPLDSLKLDSLKGNKVKGTSALTTSDKDMTIQEIASPVVKSSSTMQWTGNEKETLQKSSPIGEISIKDRAPTVAFMETSSENGTRRDIPGVEMASVLDLKGNQTSSIDGSQVKRTDQSPLLYIQTFDLSGCTETQQRFVAQEALDCTKALLEDENMAAQRLSIAIDDIPQADDPKSKNSPGVEPKRRKRVVEDPDMSSQPPLKRRLLEEFDRSVDGPRRLILLPEKSSPNAVMKDRRVFKYNVSLHPNITRPHRSGNNYVETSFKKTIQHSAPGESRASHSKSTFVPPFLKNAKADSCKITSLKDNVRTSAFVPPFKNQKVIVQENICKPQKDENKHHLFVTPCNSSIPPTKCMQSTTDETGNESKENIQRLAMAHKTSDPLPIACGSEHSAADVSHIMGTSSRCQDMSQKLQNVELARDMQDMRMRKKKRLTIRPLPGALFLSKTSGVPRIQLKAAVDGKPPARYTQQQLYAYGVQPHVCDITSENAESFRFNLQQFIKPEAFLDGGGVQLADGGWLIPSNDGTAGKEEFYRSLCDTPGVDPKLISEEWVYNHYRWIVWKRASMERSFPETMGSLCLNPEQVLLQLKYRYDIEVDHSRRPALRRIMERDDTAAKTLILCVCGVISVGQSPKKHSICDMKNPVTDSKVENPSAVVLLTDGWYSIKGQLDEPLTAMLHNGRLAVGGKLIVHGAQLMGSQDACSPLEAPDSLVLKICANSSRPARWDSKLGFHRDPRPFLLPVGSLYSNGGPVGCLDIIVLRSYPIQWMERKSDGVVLFRSVRAEEKEARQFESSKQRAMEILFSQIQADFEKEEKSNNKSQLRTRRINQQNIKSLQDGEELYEAVGDDPAYLEANLSEQQMQSLHTYKRSLMEKKQAELQDRCRRAVENAEDSESTCPKRDVTPVWRLCITDCTDQHGNVYQLSLWRPPSDLQSFLKEGHRYKVYNLTTSDVKKHGGSTTIQLTGTKKTRFQELQTSQEWLSTRFQPRVLTHFTEVQNPKFHPLCGEVDLTGYVLNIIDEQGPSPAFYLADGNLNFIKVRCFSSLAQSGLADVVKPRVLLAISNLQLRGQSITPTPVVYAGDLTVFSANPKEAHLQESLSQLRSLFQGRENLFVTAEEKLSHLIKSNSHSSMSSPALQTSYQASARDRRQETKTSVTSQQPVRSLGSVTPVSGNPYAANCSAEKDPSSLKRRRALDYLSRIPSPPPLSLLNSVDSPCVKKTFIPPRRSGTPGTLKTDLTPARKPVHPPDEDEWVNDEELAMIDTQALIV